LTDSSPQVDNLSFPGRRYEMLLSSDQIPALTGSSASLNFGGLTLAEQVGICGLIYDRVELEPRYKSMLRVNLARGPSPRAAAGPGMGTGRPRGDLSTGFAPSGSSTELLRRQRKFGAFECWVLIYEHDSGLGIVIDNTSLCKKYSMRMGAEHLQAYMPGGSRARALNQLGLSERVELASRIFQHLELEMRDRSTVSLSEAPVVVAPLVTGNASTPPSTLESVVPREDPRQDHPEQSASAASSTSTTDTSQAPPVVGPDLSPTASPDPPVVVRDNPSAYEPHPGALVQHDQPFRVVLHREEDTPLGFLTMTIPELHEEVVMRFQQDDGGGQGPDLPRHQPPGLVSPAASEQPAEHLVDAPVVSRGDDGLASQVNSPGSEVTAVLVPRPRLEWSILDDLWADLGSSEVKSLMYSKLKRPGPSYMATKKKPKRDMALNEVLSLTAVREGGAAKRSKAKGGQDNGGTSRRGDLTTHRPKEILSDKQTSSVDSLSLPSITRAVRSDLGVGRDALRSLLSRRSDMTAGVKTGSSQVRPRQIHTQPLSPLEEKRRPRNTKRTPGSRPSAATGLTTTSGPLTGLEESEGVKETLFVVRV
jgi:hypothetical protein